MNEEWGQDDDALFKHVARCYWLASLDLSSRPDEPVTVGETIDATNFNLAARKAIARRRRPTWADED